MTRDPIPLPLHHPPNNHGKLLGLKFLLSRFPSSHIPSPTLTPRAPPLRAPHQVPSPNLPAPKSGTCHLLFSSNSVFHFLVGLQSTRWHVTSFQTQLVALCRGGRVVQHYAEIVHGRLTRAQSVRVPPSPFLPTSDTNNATSDPFIVLVLSLSFIASIFFLHISAKIIRAFSK